MLTVIAHKDLKEAMESCLSGVGKGYDWAIVSLGLIGREDGTASLKEVIRLAEAGQPVLVLAWEDEAFCAQDPMFHVAMSYQNVEFVRQPVSQTMLGERLSVMKAGRTRPADPLARMLLTVPLVDNERLSVIRHGMNHALRDGGDAAERYDPEWMPPAKAIFGDQLSRDELVKAVQSATEDNYREGYFAGQEFPDVCVDIEGTLLNSDLSLRADVLELVNRLAADRPITVWTGGRVEALTRAVRNHRIAYKILPKALFAGAKVAMVIDDLPQAEFDAQYRVRYSEYHRVL